MDALKYKIIKSRKQYDEYCNILEELVFQNQANNNIQILEEIELLTLLIAKWDKENNSFIEKIFDVVQITMSKLFFFKYN